MRRQQLAYTAVTALLAFLWMHPTRVDAVNVRACGTKLLQQQNAARNVTDPTACPSALKISREQCMRECGTGVGDINWQRFSRTFGAWCIPWISLMFQIPFGAEAEPLDNVLSFLITIGSPALAAYSLQITHLNKSWIRKAFLGVDYPNSKLVPTALMALHHFPIRLELDPPYLHSLIVLSKNDNFWFHFATANRPRQWSILLFASYLLVYISVTLTIINALTSNPVDTGYSISAAWSFLLPLVIGWLYVGCESEPVHLRNSLASANQNAWVATEERGQPKRMLEPVAIKLAGADDVGLAGDDELKPVPVFNYSRAFATLTVAEVLLKMMKNAAANAKRGKPVGGWKWVEGENGEVHPENRLGTTTEVTEYCTRTFEPPKKDSDSVSSRMAENTCGPFDDDLAISSRWASGIWRRVVVASLLALGLQWGTAGAAVLVCYMVPPVGLGCRGLSFAIYGVAGTLSFFLFLASSILAHMSRPLPGRVSKRSPSHIYREAGAIVCRWLGNCVAIASAIGILLVCFFHITGMFNNCFCASTTFDMGSHWVVFKGINYTPDPGLVKNWIGGLFMAFSTSILFGFSMYIGLPPRRHD